MKKILLVLIVLVLLSCSVSAVGLLASSDKPNIINIGDQSSFEYVVKGDSDSHQIELFASASENGFVNFNGESKYSEIVTISPFETKVVDFNIIGEKDKDNLTISYGFKFLDGGSDGVSFQQVVQDDFVVDVRCVDCAAKNVDVTVNFDKSAVKKVVGSSSEGGGGSGGGSGSLNPVGEVGNNNDSVVAGDSVVVKGDSGSGKGFVKDSSNNFVSDVPSKSGFKNPVVSGLLSSGSKSAFIAFFISLSLFFVLTLYTYFYVKRSGSV